MPSRLLPIYLNDHLAGSILGVQLARRARASNEGTELGQELAGLCAEIEADQATLRRLMDHLDIAESRVKPGGAWLGEKLGRLKLNGRLRGYSPLSRVVELEGLCLGINGKMLLWKSLGRTFGETLSGFDFVALAGRAATQRDRLEPFRLEAAGEAFDQAPTTSTGSGSPAGSKPRMRP